MYHKNFVFNYIFYNNNMFTTYFKIFTKASQRAFLKCIKQIYIRLKFIAIECLKHTQKQLYYQKYIVSTIIIII